MALGDGSSWDETLPTDGTTAIQIDDYNRDLRVGISARMRHEHEWPASQSATSEGGKHKWITFQALTAKPTLAGTQISGIYCKTDNLFFEKSAGTEVQIVAGTAVGDGKVLMSATDTSAGYLIDKIDGVTLTASGTSLAILSTLSSIVVGTYTGNGAARTVTVGFADTSKTPAITFVRATKTDANRTAQMRFSSAATNRSWGGSAIKYSDTDMGDRITGETANGIIVGTHDDVNSNGEQYLFVCAV